MLPDGTLLVTPGPIRIKKNEEPKEPKEKKTRNKKGKDAQSTDGVAGPSGENVGGNEATTDVPPTEQTSDKVRPHNLLLSRHPTNSHSANPTTFQVCI
jgi:hypothetical protein